MMSPRSLTVVSLFSFALLLAGFSPPSSAMLRCCYKGDSPELQASSVEIKLEDGRTVTFGELFPDFEASSTLFPLYYPVYRLAISRVVYSHLFAKFSFYDANKNGYIEEPELTVLYIEETARGLDKSIAQVGGEQRLGAIFVSPGDIDGLIRLVARHRSAMKPDARKTFDEIELLRRDFRLDGTEPGEQGDGWM